MTIELSVTPTLGLQLQRRAEIVSTMKAIIAKRTNRPLDSMKVIKRTQKAVSGLQIDRRLGLEGTTVR